MSTYKPVFVKRPPFLQGQYDPDVLSRRLNMVRADIAPTSNTATGNKGEIIITDDYLYICIATNSWKRVAISTF